MTTSDAPRTMLFSSAQNPRSWDPNPDFFEGGVITCLTDGDAKKAEALFNALQSQLAERDAALAGLLNAEYCQYCQNQGWYADVEPNRNTGEAEQVQVECEWCYTTKNSFFNVRASLPESAKQAAKVIKAALKHEHDHSRFKVHDCTVCQAVRGMKG